MAIGTFAQLKTAIAEWADAGTSVDDRLADFVSMTTHMFNYGADGVSPLRVRDMEAVVSLTPTDGVCTLPADYLQYRRVVEDLNTRRELDYVTPSSADQIYPVRSSGPYGKFTIVGSSLYVYPLSEWGYVYSDDDPVEDDDDDVIDPVTGNDVELTYYKKIPDLSDSATTNWLLTAHPSLYLHGGLLQLAMFRRDESLTARSAAMIKTLLAGITGTDVLGNYAYATVKPRGITIA